MQIQKVIRTGFSVLFLLLITIPIAAQNTTTSIDTSRVYALDEVIISASRWEQSPATVGRNVTVITSDEINRSIHSSVGDLLAEQQSVHIVGNNQTAGSVQSVFLRNTNSNHSAVMIDGVRISDPSTAGNSIDLSELSLAGVERIEIVRGSHSTLYGSSAIGGVINIITRGYSNSESGLAGSVETNHGTFGSDSYAMSNRISVNYSFKNGFYADLGVTQEEIQGMDATIDTVTGTNIYNPQDRDDFSKLDLNGKVGYQTSSLDLYASYRRAGQENDLDQSAFTDDDNARIDFRRDLYSYGGAYDISDQVELGFSGAYSNLERDFVNDSSLVDREGNYDGIYTESRGEGTLLENELTGQFQTNDATVIIGVGNSRQTMNTRSYTYSSAFDFESESDLDSLDLRETINHAFIHSELNGRLISDNLETFTLGLGSRISRHNQFGTHLTYEINPRVQISPSALLYGAMTSGFNAPSLYQLYSPAQNLNAHTDRGNRNLKPESSLSLEVGWKQGLGSSAHIEVALFRTHLENVIEYVYLWNSSTAFENLSASDYLGDTYINISDQEINGVELGARVQLLPRLHFNGNLTYTRSTLRFVPGDIDEAYTGGHHVQIYEGGQFVNEEKEINGLIRRPQLSGSASLSYRPLDPFEVGINTRFTGKNDDIFYSASLGPYGALDRAGVDRYNITDVYVGYQLSSILSLKVKVNNIFNTEYAEINGYNTRSRGVYGRIRFAF